ncbi:phosphatidylglycerol lysyltransferase domain-containing protein [Nitrospira sp. Kam-Ns4a]
MDFQAQACPPKPARLRVLPQIVPSQVCLRCEVCCRFPEPDSFLRPYFTAEEIRRAVAAGVDPASFPDPQGGQVRVVPNPAGEGYLCPAFDPATSHCRIYEVRPLDCQLYPFALMWSATGDQVVLGWDTKCPFMAQRASSGQGGRGMEPDLEAQAERLAELLEHAETLDAVARHPRLVGPFQDDVVIVRTLPQLTERVRASGTPCRSLSNRSSVSEASFALHPSSLTLQDRPRFEQATAAVTTPLGAYGFAYHFIWHRLLAYSAADCAGYLCLFAESPDGWFMPLPPLPAGDAGDRSSFREVLAHVFAFMRERNGARAVTRIENVPEELRPLVEAAGYRVVPKDAEYLYRARNLARLAGDRYKSQRAACNRFMRLYRYEYEPYRPEDREACLALYRRWAEQQAARELPSMARQMLEDAALAHDEALFHAEALGLVGRVVRVGETVAAYTFGYRRSPSVFCVLLEVADRNLPGLAQFLFREFCREAAEAGYEFINSLDDSGLPGLAASKRAYRPVCLVSSYVVTEASP